VVCTLCHSVLLRPIWCEGNFKKECERMKQKKNYNEKGLGSNGDNKFHGFYLATFEIRLIKKCHIMMNFFLTMPKRNPTTTI
jgi:hypothetical protein